MHIRGSFLAIKSTPGFNGARLSQQQVDLNTRMSEVRVSVEWMFGAVITYFKFLDFRKDQLGKCILYELCYTMQGPVYMETEHLLILIVSSQHLRSIMYNYLSR